MRLGLSKMRSLVLPAVLLASGLLLGCDGDGLTLGTGGGGGGNGSGTMTASVAGEAWAGDTVQATHQNGVLSFAGAQFNGSTNKQINITGMISAPGTYNFGIGGAVATYADATTGSVVAYTATSGSVIVDTLDANGASGTFAFTGLNPSPAPGTTIQVTNGVFDVEF